MFEASQCSDKLEVSFQRHFWLEGEVSAWVSSPFLVDVTALSKCIVDIHNPLT